MPCPFHPGELAVQKRVGVSEQARDLEGMYRNVVPPAVAGFLAQHGFAILSSESADGTVWASPLAGPAGIFSVPDAHEVTIHLDRLNPQIDPTLVQGRLAGLLVIDFDRRLRLRINGESMCSAGVSPSVPQAPTPALTLRVGQFYGNCQKYIQRRLPENPVAGVSRDSVHPNISRYLTGAHSSLIARSDTFFIATQNPDSGADASHRGGRPGFVVVVDERTLRWPDYRGNNMFNTLGNLESDPRAGLLFVDFDSGASLQLTGSATADFGDPSSFAPTGRSIRFDISSVRKLPPSPYLRYSLIEPFPYNPPVALSPAP